MNNFDQQLALLRQKYHAYLNSAHPARPQGGLVAGSKTRQGILAGQGEYDKTKEGWDEFLTAWQSTPQHVYVWSDLHLFHDNIRKYGERPFYSLEQMHATFLENASILGKDDYLLCCGDLSFGQPSSTKEFLDNIPAKKLWILGNHDVDKSYKKEIFGEFLGVSDVFVLPFKEKNLWLTHYPVGRDFLPAHVINVHGHTHQYAVQGPYVNVCMERRQYTPVRLMDCLTP